MPPSGESKKVIVEVEIGNKKYVFPITVIVPKLSVTVRFLSTPRGLGVGLRGQATIEVYNSYSSDIPLSNAFLIIEPLNERIDLPKIDVGKSISLKVPVAPGHNVVKVIHNDRVVASDSVYIEVIKPIIKIEPIGESILYYPRGGSLEFKIADNNVPYKITDIKVKLATKDRAKVVLKDGKIKVNVKKLSKLMNKIPLELRLKYTDLEGKIYEYKETFSIPSTLPPELKQEIEEKVWNKVREADKLLSQELIGKALTLLEEAYKNSEPYSEIVDRNSIQEKIVKVKKLINEATLKIQKAIPVLEDLLKNQKYRELESKLKEYKEICSKVGERVELCKRVEYYDNIVSGIKHLLTKGVIISIPRRVRPRPFKVTLNIINPLKEAIRGLTIDFTPSKEFFEFEEEKIVIPVIRGGTKGLSRDLRVKPKYKGELVLLYRILLGDYTVEREEPITVEEVITPTPRVEVIKALVGKGITSLATYGKPLIKVHKLTKPVKILNYQCIGLLGTGGFAVTLLGVNERGEKVVIKTTIEYYNMLLTGASIEYPTVEEELAKKFEREARILKELKHPNIVKLIEYTTQPPVLVLEYCELGDLRGVIMKLQEAGRSFLHPKDALELIIPVTDALAYAHSLKEPIIHRDVKPENILLTSDYIPKLTDFNIAKIMSTVSKTSRSKGEYTPGYGAPEQLGISELPLPGPYTDVFSLATVLYEILTGKRPYPLEAYERLFRDVRKPTPPSEMNGEIPKELDEIVLLSLEIDPRDRPQNARELESMLIEVYHKYYM